MKMHRKESIYIQHLNIKMFEYHYTYILNTVKSTRKDNGTRDSQLMLQKERLYKFVVRHASYQSSREGFQWMNEEDIYPREKDIDGQIGTESMFQNMSTKFRNSGSENYYTTMNSELHINDENFKLAMPP